MHLRREVARGSALHYSPVNPALEAEATNNMKKLPETAHQWHNAPNHKSEYDNRTMPSENQEASLPTNSKRA